jgi:hypothetical protein
LLNEPLKKSRVVFDESSVPKRDHKGSSKTHLDTIQFIVEKTPIVDLNASFKNT